MNRKLLLVASLVSAFSISGLAQNEASEDSLIRQSNASFIFSEEQIGEDDDVAKSATLISDQHDPYMKEVGYLFSPMRFNVRAYDSQYSGNYFNGVRLNNVETGRYSFSGMQGGLNDAVRNNEGISAYDRNNFGYASIGGASNINVRASQYPAGDKVGLALTNRNYTTRLNYTHGSGVNANGWSWVASVAYRYGNPGVIEGTFYNSFSYLLGVEKFINDQHRLSLTTWGAPTERAQQGASTEEAYWLANSHYYNPYWGYQNGKKRNSRVVNEFSPSVLLTWDWKIDELTKLTTTAAFTYSNYASTAISYNNAYNPRPDYYKNFPSSVLNVYDTDKYNNPDWIASNPGVMDQYWSLYNLWQNKETRQIQWDKLYAQNIANNQYGKDALYYVEKRHNDQAVWRLASNFSKDITNDMNYSLGISLNHTTGIHYKTMDDLLGAKIFHDYDSYSIADYGMSSPEVQNDLLNPNRVIKEGDKFGYDYNIYVNKAQAYGQYSAILGAFSAVVSADIEGTTMSRYGNMSNGRGYDTALWNGTYNPQYDFSRGSSAWAKFLGGGGKAILSYYIGQNTFSIAGGYESQAPLAFNSFVAPRVHNNFVNNLKNEQILFGQASVKFKFGVVSGKITGFYTQFNNVTQQSGFYNDDMQYFTYLTMTGVKREHYGLEGAVTFKILDNLKLNLLGTISDAKYVGNPLAQLAYEGSNAATTREINLWKNPITKENQELRVIMDGVHVGSTPLTAASIGLDYNINRWYISVNANYYANLYIDASPYKRLGYVMDNVKYYTNEPLVDIEGNVKSGMDEAKAKGGNVYDYQTGKLIASYTPEQDKSKPGWMIDASVGRQFRLRHGKVLNVNLQVNNINNNRNLKTGGYEQNRNDKATYQFSKNSFYWYANAINAFLTVSLRF